jgi:hypothetical protein
MTTENGSEEPQEDQTETLEQLRARLSAMNPTQLGDEYKTRKAEFDYLATQSASEATKSRQLELREEMLAISAAHTTASATVEAPDLGTPDTPDTPEGSNANQEDPPAEDPPAEDPPAEDPPAEDPPAEDPPAEDPPVETPDSSGNAGGTGAGLDSDRQVDIVEPFIMEGGDNKSITSIEELGLAMAAAAGGKYHSLGSFSPYGQFNREEQLTRDPEANYRLIYGQDTALRTAAFSSAQGTAEASERSSFTAALNCKGPAQPVMDIPFCYTAGRPLFDSGLVSAFPSVHGQIQIYDCRRLPEKPDGIMEEAADCEDCATCPDLVCATHECIEPMDPIEPNRYITCMCVPESLQFSNPIVLERALEEFAIWNDIAYELDWLKQIRDLSVIRDVVGAAPHGAHATIMRSMYTLKSRMALDVRRNCGGLNNYDVFIPGGEALFCSTMIDKMSRLLGCSCPGEDILEIIEGMTTGRVIFGLDQDPDGPQVAEGYTTTWSDGVEPELGTPLPLEDPVDAGEMVLIPRDSLATASPMSSEIGMGERDRCTHAGGCMKMQRSEWWFPIFQVGCRQPVVLQFTNLGMCGTGPDLEPCA